MSESVTGRPSGDLPEPHLAAVVPDCAGSEAGGQRRPEPVPDGLEANGQVADGPAAAGSSAAAGESSSGAARRRRRRGSRGGRGRARPVNEGDAGEADGDGVTPLAPAAEIPGPMAPPAAIPAGSSSRLGGPPVAASRPKIGDTRPAPPPRAPVTRAEPRAQTPRTSTPRPESPPGGAPAGADGEETSSRRRRRRGGRGRSGAAVAAGRRPVEALVGDTSDAVELDEEVLGQRRGRERKGRPVGRYLMAVNVRPHATQIAVLEGRSLIEHYVSRPSDDDNQIDGNIYLGRVQNVLPGMEAAFVDIGTPKNAVLYRGDVHYDRDDVEGGGGLALGKQARIEQLLRPGQVIICQVTKNPIGTKGARLTQEVSLPGRFVVLIPDSDTYGISKRLSDEERKRLRRILDEVKPANHGIIVRTAAEGVTSDELRRDVARLLRQWEQIEALASQSRAPALLYREPDMAVRVIREEFNKQYRGVVIDDRALFEEVRDYVASISPELADRVEFSGDDDDPLPIFERYHVHEQLHKALDRKVWLPSGGSLIIERTEALTVIDVNTGKNVGTSSLEETVYRNNLEAAEEIARQLRLRDIGGIIVIDLIDMEILQNRADVMRAFRAALARDKTRTQVFDISELGLVEMTRKRISEGLVESLSQTCPTCAGRGIVLDESLL